MFGKSEWFEATCCGFAAKPANWAGRLYYALWLAVVFVPAGLIYAVNGGDWLAGAFWVLPALALFAIDVRSQAKAVAARLRECKDVFYVGFDDDVADEVATRNYDLRLRR